MAILCELGNGLDQVVRRYMGGAGAAEKWLFGVLTIEGSRQRTPDAHYLIGLEGCRFWGGFRSRGKEAEGSCSSEAAVSPDPEMFLNFTRTSR